MKVHKGSFLIIDKENQMVESFETKDKAVKYVKSRPHLRWEEFKHVENNEPCELDDILNA